MNSVWTVQITADFLGLKAKHTELSYILSSLTSRKQLPRQAVSKRGHWQGRAAPVHVYVKVHSETQHYKRQKHSRPSSRTVSSWPYSLTNTHSYTYTQINTYIHTQTLLPHTVGERSHATAVTAAILLVSLWLLGLSAEMLTINRRSINCRW